MHNSVGFVVVIIAYYVCYCLVETVLIGFLNSQAKHTVQEIKIKQIQGYDSITFDRRLQAIPGGLQGLLLTFQDHPGCVLESRGLGASEGRRSEGDSHHPRMDPLNRGLECIMAVCQPENIALKDLGEVYFPNQCLGCMPLQFMHHIQK